MTQHQRTIKMPEAPFAIIHSTTPSLSYATEKENEDYTDNFISFLDTPSIGGLLPALKFTYELLTPPTKYLYGLLPKEFP